MSPIDLNAFAASLPTAWKSVVVGPPAGANFKVLRMDGMPYEDEVHDHDEALLVLTGQMNLGIGGQVMPVRAGEVFVVPSGQPHSVAPGSHGTLVIIDR